MKLLKLLAEYSRHGKTPMHMPGHKRNTRMAPYLKALGAEYDITEIEGFDNLHNPEGVLLESMNKAARLFGSKKSFYLVGGSTVGILAAISALSKREGKALCDRFCHRSVFNALELLGKEAVFFSSDTLKDFGIPSSVNISHIKEALEKETIAFIVLTSPTYHGVLSDVDTICKIAHEKGVPVLVDSAHGAHLGLFSAFPKSAVQSGADIVVESLHKTLPSLTQTGVLHLNGSLVSEEDISRQLIIFMTSSPSYLLMASIDGCVSLLSEKGEKLFTDYKKNLDRFYETCKALKNLKLLKKRDDIFDFDMGKIVVSTHSSSISAPELAEMLREENIEPEMCDRYCVVLMTSISDRKKILKKLSGALIKIDKGISKGAKEIVALPRNQLAKPVFASILENKEELSLKSAKERVCGEYIYSYPPGIPIIIPGEIIGKDSISYIESAKKEGIKIYGEKGEFKGEISVLKEI